MQVFGWKVTSQARNPSFENLLEIIPSNLDRSQTKRFLSEYKLIEEGKKSDLGFFQDYYYLEGVLPRPSARIIYDGDVPSSEIIHFVYPKPINKLAVRLARRALYSSLEKLLSLKFGLIKVEKGFSHHRNESVLAFASKYEEKDGRLGIKIDILNAQNFPIHKIFEDFERKTGHFAKS